MARIRKCKLCWEASTSENVVGYKLYWSRGTEVDYDAKYIKIGSATEIILPDDVIFSDGPVMFGVTAVDRDGNESDMVTIDRPYRMQVPDAPTGLSIQPSEEFELVERPPQREDFEIVRTLLPEQNEDEDPLAKAIEDDDATPPTKITP
jgi:hypothetical protein